jgi:hypothetical protein
VQIFVGFCVAHHNIVDFQLSNGAIATENCERLIEYDCYLSRRVVAQTDRNAQKDSNTEQEAL